VPAIRQKLHLSSCSDFRDQLCGHTLAAVEKNGIAIGWHCVSHECHKQHRKVSKKQRCSVCDTVVHGLSVPCLQCGHLTCYDCAQGWFGQRPIEDRKRSNSTTLSRTQSTTTAESPGCPTGCGCSCSVLNEINLPYPHSTSAGTDQDISLVTSRSKEYADGLKHTSILTEHRDQRGQPLGAAFGAPESAFNALLALQGQSRHRSTSSTHTAFTAIAPPHPKHASEAAARGTRTRDNSVSTVDELLPWTSDVNGALGPGRDALRRGLSNKGSDSTIRRAMREL